MSARQVDVATDPGYAVRIGSGLLAELAGALAAYRRVAIIADERVLELHGSRLDGLEIWPRYAFAKGEAAKSLIELACVLEFMAGAQLDRSSAVLTFGGGVASDLGGLAAALFKRGIDVLHAPTTLLAQVDAAVGGKTGVNLAAGKNLAGVVHQPRGVWSDTALLATLPDEELRSGLGEVLKTALVGGEGELARLEERAAALVARDGDAATDVVADCVAVKARVVAADPLERGGRQVLNLGHTLGHAIEGAAGYGVVPHGEAVAVGLVLSLELSARSGRLEDRPLLERVRVLARSLGLPLTLAELRQRYGTRLEPAALARHLAQDKKGAVGEPRFVLLRAAGRLEHGVEVPRALVDALLD